MAEAAIYLIRLTRVDLGRSTVGLFGPSNPLPFHEVYMYCLDALPMSIALFIMCISHPGHTLIGPDSEFPTVTRKEKKAAKAAKKAEKLAFKATKKAEKLRLEDLLPSESSQEPLV